MARKKARLERGAQRLSGKEKRGAAEARWTRALGEKRGAQRLSGEEKRGVAEARREAWRRRHEW